MIHDFASIPSRVQILTPWRMLLAFVLVATTLAGWPAHAQGPGDGDEPLLVDVGEIQSVMQDAPDESAAGADEPSGIDLLTLITSGGAFMIPIGLMSVLVVALAVERFLALRRRKIIPSSLADHLTELAHPVDQFSPTGAFRLCEETPSPTSRVIQAMLLRTGRPLSEIEAAASDAIEREVDRFSSPIRWLSLAAAATPLMGLLGTVWGMIVAFHESTSLTADRSRSEQLSEGIYTALVTTLAGLVVAIPAAMLALYLENRLIKMFHRVEELAFRIAPGLNRFTGNHRLDPDGRLMAVDSLAPPPQPPPPPNDSTGENNGETRPPRGAKAKR